MKVIYNTTEINNFVNSIDQTQEELNKTKNQLRNYVNKLKEEKIEKIEGETKEEELIRYEGIYDRLLEKENWNCEDVKSFCIVWKDKF